MPRRRPPERFDRLLDAALRVFSAKGLRRARMADVAREMGVSPGALYNWVESKEALFHWIVERAAQDGPVRPPATLPVPTPPPGETEKRLRERLAEGVRLPRLEAALARRRAADARAELGGILEELWERVARTRGALAMLERSAIDVPSLRAIWFGEARRALFEQLASYVGRRAQGGAFRPVDDPRVAARALVESVTYFARHRHGDLDPDLLPEDAAVRAVVIPMLVASLVPDARPSRGRR